MQHNLRASLMQFANVLQTELFPRLSEEVGPMSSHTALFVAACVMIPFERYIPCGRWIGRPSRDRLSIARAFLAKSIFGLKTTRQLLERLRVDTSLRSLCGWSSVRQLPHESTFSRAFAEFAESGLPEFAHEAVIKATQSQRLIGHISRDSTAIQARERYPESKLGKLQRGSGAKTKDKKKALGASRLPEQSLRMDGEQMMMKLPVRCSLGVKQSSRGHRSYWRGYKLHLDVADGQIPITALVTSASLHDSQAAIPMMRVTSKRVTYLYDLMDSAYDAELIHQVSGELNHLPIIDTKSPQNQVTQLPSRRKLKKEMAPAQKMRFRNRTTVERVYSRLKDEFGAADIRVRGGKKVAAHLMFGVLALTVDQLLRLAG